MRAALRVSGVEWSGATVASPSSSSSSSALQRVKHDLRGVGRTRTTRTDADEVSFLLPLTHILRIQRNGQWQSSVESRESSEPLDARCGGQPRIAEERSRGGNERESRRAGGLRSSMNTKGGVGLTFLLLLRRRPRPLPASEQRRSRAEIIYNPFLLGDINKAERDSQPRPRPASEAARQRRRGRGEKRRRDWDGEVAGRGHRRTLGRPRSGTPPCPLPPSTVQAGVRDSDGERVSLLPVLLGIVVVVVVVVGVVGDNGSEERWCPFKRRR